MAPESASLLDLISVWMDTYERPLDFAVVAHLDRAADVAALERGAESARSRFVRTRSRMHRDAWVPCDDVSRIAPLNGDDVQAALDAIFAVVLDPTKRVPLEQVLLGDRVLITRCHHAAGDLASALAFLDHQLRVARGDPVSMDSSPLCLRKHPNPARKSAFAHTGPSTPLWTRRAARGRRRCIHFIELDAGPLRGLVERCGRFTYNDLLGTAALVALGRFQAEHGAPTSKLSLWFPVNVRVDPWSGFGNGSSRIRIYDRAEVNLLDRAASFREQVVWSKDHGEWAMPEKHPLLSLPDSLKRAALTAYFRRPWVDMGTLLFSHAEKVGPDEQMLAGVARLEVLANLDERHSAGLAGVTLRGRTQLSLTWDPAQLDAQDADRFLELYREAIAQACAELERCAA
jgi:hypothetical protein